MLCLTSTTGGVLTLLREHVNVISSGVLHDASQGLSRFHSYRSLGAAYGLLLHPRCTIGGPPNSLTCLLRTKLSTPFHCPFQRD